MTAATGRPAGGGRAATAAALGLWSALIVVSHVWGLAVFRDRPNALIFGPPFAGPIDLRLDAPIARVVGYGLGLAAATIAAVAWGPLLVDRLRWRSLLLAAFLAAAAWAVALSALDGPHGLVRPLLTRFDYLHDLPLVRSPGDFLRTFTDRILAYTTQVRGHPPGTILLLWAMDRVGLGGAGWAAAVAIAGGASAVPAVMMAVREMASESAARRAAPYLALAPTAVLVATSMDALYTGVGAWGVALFVLSTGRRDRSGDALALAGGLLLGIGLFLSYGLVPLGAVVVATAWARRRIRPLVVAAVGVAVVVLAFLAAGFWWVEGFLATGAVYAQGVSRLRPYGYFVVGNLAAFAAVVGPAGAAGLAGLRDRRAWVLVAGALVAILAADLSGLSKGEAERIWLPFAPWVLVATCALPVGAVGLEHGIAQWIRARRWLALHVASVAAFVVVVRTAF